MEHTHSKTGTTYQIGQLFDSEGKAFDITIITNWTDTYDPEDDNWTNLIDFYFGDYSESVTNYCIEQFLDRQKQIIKAIAYLERLKLMDPTVTSINTTISSLKSMLVTLH